MPLAKAKVSLPIWSVPFSASARQSDLRCSASSLCSHFSLSFTGCSWHAQLHACCIYTCSSNSIFLLLVLACLHMDTHTDTHSHVCTKPCVFAFFCRQLCCLILQTTIHARQSRLSQYMLGKVILAIQNPCMLQHAPVAECGAEYPLVIFSHGIGGNRVAYSAIICSLVRQVHPSFRLPP